jgi:hypothetical protein
MTEDDVRKLLRELRDEPVEADSLRRVRIAVEERTRPRTIRWWWSIAAVGAMACLVLLMMLMREPALVHKPAPRVLTRDHQAPAPEQPVPLETRVPPKRRIPVRAVARQAAPSKTKPVSTENLVIRIETPDPDVVILLIGD